MTATELTDDGVRILGELREAKAAVKAWAERADTLQSELANVLTGPDGDIADTATVGGTEVLRYTLVEQTRLDSRKLKESWPDVYAQYARTSAHYRLTLA